MLLFGEEDGLADAAADLGARHIPQVNRNEYGTPLLNSVFDRAQEIAQHPILCYANCDILLLNDFRDAVAQVAAWRKRFLMVGRRWDTEITELIDFSQPDWNDTLRTLALRTNKPRPPFWIDYFAFPKGQYYRKVPAFAVGRPVWDRWMIWSTRRSSAPVVDATPSVVAIHQNHDYSHHPLGFKGVMEGAEAKANARLLGSRRRLFTIEHAQYRLEKAGPRWDHRYLMLPFQPLWKKVSSPFWSAWFALLSLTRPLRHALGLRQKKAMETKSGFTQK